METVKITMNNEQVDMIVTNGKHICNNRIVIPKPLDAHFVPGINHTYIEAFCPTCDAITLLTIDEYYDLYQEVKPLAPRVTGKPIDRKTRQVKVLRGGAA